MQGAEAVEIGYSGGRFGNLVRQDALPQCVFALRLEGKLVGEKLVKDATEGPNICLLVVGLVFEDLG